MKTVLLLLSLGTWVLLGSLPRLDRASAAEAAEEILKWPDLRHAWRRALTTHPWATACRPEGRRYKGPVGALTKNLSFQTDCSDSGDYVGGALIIQAGGQDTAGRARLWWRRGQVR